MSRFIKTITLVPALLVAVALAIPANDASAQGQQAKRSITKVKGDVYRFQNNFHFAMFVVTNDGIVVTDPINADAVGWLKAELQKRFNKPVTHMIYSHSHADHASGGEAWGGGLEVIGHTNNPLVKTKFDDSMTVKTGGKTIELKYLGPGHGDDLIAMVVRPENVAFVVDAISPKRLPFRNFPRTDIGGLIEQIKVVESLDFELMAPGHSVVGTKQDATDTRLYIEDLMRQVTAGLKAGKSVDDLAANLTMEKYKHVGAYKQFRELNIRGMARWLKSTGKV